MFPLFYKEEKFGVVGAVFQLEGCTGCMLVVFAGQVGFSFGLIGTDIRRAADIIRRALIAMPMRNAYIELRKIISKSDLPIVRRLYENGRMKKIAS